MKRILKIVGVLFFVVVLAGAGFYGWASITASRVLARSFAPHVTGFPIPFPLDDEELTEAGLTSDEGGSVAMQRALERGQHLVEARYGCLGCHGEDFSGGVMVDDRLLGRILGPNLTGGRGSRTTGYGPSDWDHIVRHGVLPSGRPAAMPSEGGRIQAAEEVSPQRRVGAYAPPPGDDMIDRLSVARILVLLLSLTLAACEGPGRPGGPGR